MGEVQIVSHARKADKEIDNAFERALTIIGMKAESYAKAMAPVDTGNLRNSITYALGGQSANAGKYQNNEGAETGQYQGSAPGDKTGQKTLYVGTNVHYAPYVELGHHTKKGIFVEPKSFLRPAMEGHTDEYMEVVEDQLSKI